MPAEGSASDGWSAILKTLEDMQGRFTGGMEDGGDSLHRMMAFWELPYDNWQRMVSSMSPMPGDALRNMPHDPVRGHVDRMLSAPGLGYTREEQTQYQDLTRRTLDYQKALQEYLGFYSKLGIKSIERMRGYLQGVVDSGKSIDSARAVYDNWVQCCEQVYAEEVITPEYAKIHGHLINSQMALKKRMSVIVDEYLGALEHAVALGAAHPPGSAAGDPAREQASAQRDERPQAPGVRPRQSDRHTCIGARTGTRGDCARGAADRPDGGPRCQACSGGAPGGDQEDRGAQEDRPQDHRQIAEAAVRPRLTRSRLCPQRPEETHRDPHRHPTGQAHRRDV